MNAIPGVPATLDLVDFTDAEVSARIAAEEFADAAEKYGRKVALERFNLQVSHWANRFTNRRYRRYVYTVASCMDGSTHSFRISQAALMAKYRKQHPGHKIGHTALQTYNRVMDEAGVFDVIHHRQDSEDEHPGAYRTTEYRVRFSRVLADDLVVPHDFTQISPSARPGEPDISHSGNKTRNGGGDGNGDGGTDVLLRYSSPDSSKNSSTDRHHQAADDDGSLPLRGETGQRALPGRRHLPRQPLPGPQSHPPGLLGVPAVRVFRPSLQTSWRLSRRALPKRWMISASASRAGFGMDLLTRPDQQDARAGLVILSREGTDWRDVVQGLLISGGHRAGKIQQGAQWLNKMFRDIGEPELRKWEDIERERQAEIDRNADEALAQWKREQADQAAEEERRQAEQERVARIKQEIHELMSVVAKEIYEDSPGSMRDVKVSMESGDRYNSLDKQLVWLKRKIAEHEEYERQEAAGRKLVAAWMPTLDGVDFGRVRITDEPMPVHINVRDLTVYQGRLSVAYGALATVWVKMTGSGPVLADPPDDYEL